MVRDADSDDAGAAHPGNCQPNPSPSTQRPMLIESSQDLRKLLGGMKSSRLSSLWDGEMIFPRDAVYGVASSGKHKEPILLSEVSPLCTDPCGYDESKVRLQANHSW